MTNNLKKYIDEHKLFDNHYYLIRLLSQEGGTADIWLAENYESVDTKFSEEQDDVVRIDGSGVRVAIKIYRPKNILDVEGEQLFRQEFKTIFNCHHANLLPTTDYSICDGMPYLVMPYCENGSAEKYIGKLIDSNAIWKFIYDTASGLDYLHSCVPPIIHQDIKPANILIDANENFCITDFGISVKSGITDDNTLDNLSSGTTIYMPPERFEEDYVPTEQSDIWSLGATIYELITGDVPFGDRGGKAQQEQIKVPAITVPIPKEIKKLVYSCLDVDPNKRPTARQIAEIARNKGKREVRKLIIPATAIILLSGTALTWFLSIHSTKIDPLTALCNSGDSIVRIQQQEARSEGAIDYDISYERFQKAIGKYSQALKQPSSDHHKQDSIKIIISNIKSLFPILEEYKGINDTLQQVIEDELPIQIDNYTHKKEEILKKLKQHILEL